MQLKAQLSLPWEPKHHYLCFANYLTLAAYVTLCYWHFIGAAKHDLNKDLCEWLTSRDGWMSADHVLKLSFLVSTTEFWIKFLKCGFLMFSCSWYFLWVYWSVFVHYFFSVTKTSNLKPYCSKDQACKLHDFYHTYSKKEDKTNVTECLC